MPSYSDLISVVPEKPTFDEFVRLRAALLESNSALLDCAETRMAPLLKPMLPAFELGAGVGYRCHVAQHWLSLQSLPAPWLPRLLVSGGVRDSLSILFSVWAKEGLTVAVPQDVYPVYLTLARETGLNIVLFPALLGLPATLPPADVLLLANPLKPLGRELVPQEVQRLLAWLKAQPSRRLVLDTVYRFEQGLSASTLQLYERCQTIVLHSLSKAWASPLRAGFALVPPADAERFTDEFRARPANRVALYQAEQLLNLSKNLPRRLSQALGHRRDALSEQLERVGLSYPFPSVPGQYLFMVPTSWNQLLCRGILGLPVSVFGSSKNGYSVLSALAMNH